LSIFQKPVEKIRVSFKPDRNNGYFTWRLMYTDDDISLNSQNEKCFTQKLQRNPNPQFTFNSFFSENRVVSDTMKKNIVQPHTPHDNKYDACASHAA
jgi:hypothetical protein